MFFQYIAVEGVIGVGKSVVVEKLAERLDAATVQEEWATNPFLKTFYDGAAGAAFQTELFFLLSRYRQQQELQQRSLFKHVTLSDYVFDKSKLFAYLNAVVQGETALGAEAMLASCLGVAREAGRVRGLPNAPRTLDLDLLLYGALVLRTPGLAVPHPRMHERRFVLVPLREIAPDVRHPVLGLTAEEMAAACPDRSAVAVYGPPGLLG